MAGGMFSNFTSSMKGIFVDGAAEKAILYIYLVDISKKQDINANVLDVRKQETASQSLHGVTDAKGLLCLIHQCVFLFLYIQDIGL